MGNLPIGKFEAEISANTIRSIAGKECVSLTVRTDEGAEGEVLIFLTPKSMGMARTQLKRCGFDVDTEPLETLVENQQLLAGVRIPIATEIYNNRVSARVNLDSPPTKQRLANLSQALRDAKKAEETFADVPATAGAGGGDDEVPC